MLQIRFHTKDTNNRGKFISPFYTKQPTQQLYA